MSKENQHRSRNSHVRNTRLTDWAVQCFTIIFKRSGTIDQIGVFTDRLNSLKISSLRSFFSRISTYVDNRFWPLKSFQWTRIKSRKNRQIRIEIIQTSQMLFKRNKCWRKKQTRSFSLLLKFSKIFQNKFRVVVENFVREFEIEP